MPRVEKTLLCALAALAGAAPLPAAAERYEFLWHYKWSWGSIQHEGGIADTDPSPDRAVYDNAIRSFSLQAHAPGEALVLAGSGGGDLIVENQPAGQTGCGAIGQPACIGQRFIFELGQAFAGSTAEYRMTATAPYLWEGGPGTPLDIYGTWDVGNPDTGDGLWGVITNNLDDREFGTMSAYFGTRHDRLAAPVPEPAPVALLGLGLLAVIARRRRG